MYFFAKILQNAVRAPFSENFFVILQQKCLKVQLMDWFDFSLELPITHPTWIFLLVLLIILYVVLAVIRNRNRRRYQNVRHRRRL